MTVRYYCALIGFYGAIALMIATPFLAIWAAADGAFSWGIFFKTYVVGIPVLLWSRWAIKKERARREQEELLRQIRESQQKRETPSS